jgi:hypothetical protein
MEAAIKEGDEAFADEIRLLRSQGKAKKRAALGGNSEGEEDK